MQPNPYRSMKVLLTALMGASLALLGWLIITAPDVHPLRAAVGILCALASGYAAATLLDSE